MANISNELDVLENKIKELESKANRSITMSIGVTAVLVIILLGYFSFMASMLREAADPDGIALLVADEVNEQIPEIAKGLQDTAKEQAPILVENGIDFFIKEQLPQARQTAEAAIKEELTLHLDKYEDMVIANFDVIFENHVDRINELAGKLQSKQGQKEFEEDLVAMLDEAVVGQEVMVELEAYKTALSDLDETLLMISDKDAVLSTEQESLKHLVAILTEITNRSEFGKVNLAD